MKRFLILFAGLACLAASKASAQQPDAVTTEIQKFVRTYVDANNRADVNAMMEMIGRKAGVVSVGDGELSRGWNAIRSEAKKLVGSRGRYQILLGPVDVSSLGTGYALAIAPYTMTLSSEEGEKVQIRGALTLVLERSSGSWKIIHEHSSLGADEAGCF